MSWSYGNSPSTSATDAVRFLVGDTDTNDQLVTNEEVAYAIASTSSSVQAAAMLARALQAKFARQADKAVGDLRISASQRADAFMALAEQLESSAAVGAVPVPVAGGISILDKHAAEDDTDRVQPAFTKGGFTYPGTADDEVDRPYHEQA